MQVSERDEARAIEHLIAEIDSIDKWRDRIGRRIIALFFGVFLFAIALLGWVATHSHERVVPHGLGKPAPAVLHSYR